jgi:hypothetical protein
MQETYRQWSHDPSEVPCKILRSSPDSHRFHWYTRLKNREQVSGRKTDERTTNEQPNRDSSMGSALGPSVRSSPRVQES